MLLATLSWKYSISEIKKRKHTLLIANELSLRYKAFYYTIDHSYGYTITT